MHRRLSSWARTSDRGNVSVGPVGKRPWLDGYAGQTTDELIGLADTYRIDSVVLAFEEALAAKAERLGTASLTPAERVVLVVEAVEREVNNDGIDGLFFNPSKVYAPDLCLPWEPSVVTTLRT
jgi:hypothetical protein